VADILISKGTAATSTQPPSRVMANIWPLAVETTQSNFGVLIPREKLQLYWGTAVMSTPSHSRQTDSIWPQAAAIVPSKSGL
jgi:hypothetical protein